MRKLRQLLKRKQGTTLVEMIVTLLLISIMLAMAAGTLSSAFKIFLRVQKEQYAQSVLDTTMTQLRSLTKDATQYVKIYSDGGSPLGQTGTDNGQMLEYVNTEGYAVLLSTSGCPATDLYTANNLTGTSEAVPSGRLLTRYYRREQDTYTYQQDGKPVARDLAKVFGDKYYMGNYLGVTFSYADAGAAEGDQITALRAEVTLYSDEARTKAIARDSEILEFRYEVVRNDQVTAVTASQSADG